ncbi:MAG: peptidase [Bacteroidetes bacterium]|nr:peptidase [Bacteroidota bacterium]
MMLQYFRQSLFLACLWICQTSFAQELPIPRNFQKAFDSGTRSKNGQPGPNYWQNKALYDIKVAFSSRSRLVSGIVNIIYTNNSPDTLQEILFKLYPNLYKKGAQRLMPIDPADIGEGLSISAISVNGKPIAKNNYAINGVNMVVKSNSVAPGGTISFKIDYSYELNKGSHIRTGEVDPGAWFLAYFFPRIAVYDDIEGWNKNQYLGTQEFYNDFCDFRVAVTVPKDFLVWGTGVLANCSEVLAPKYCERLAAAENSKKIIDIIDSTDLKAGNITSQNNINVFRFEASNVTDVAYAISNHYVWKSTSVEVDAKKKRRTRVDAVYNPAHSDYQEVIHFARKTVDLMSHRFPKWPFPYPHLTVFDGLDQMEYPMMVNDNPLEDVDETIELTVHEIFHTMFPFYLGINETRYGWMDEGWATLGEWLLSPMIDPGIVDEYGMERYNKLAGTDNDLPIVTPSTLQSGNTLMVNSYPKPGLGYLYALDMLGDTVFFRGLHHYIRTWQGKHPIPNDFFQCMNAGSGVDLNWFWKSWFFENGVPDLAISKVQLDAKQAVITIENRGNKPVPVDISVIYQDKSVQKVHKSIEVWKSGAKNLDISVEGKKTVSEIRLGSTYVPDVNKSDNVWKPDGK